MRYGVYEVLKGQVLKSSEGMYAFSAQELQIYCGVYRILGQPISLLMKICMSAFAGKDHLFL